MKLKNKFGLLLLLSLALIAFFSVFLLNVNQDLLQKRQRLTFSYEQVIYLTSLKNDLRATVKRGAQVIFSGDGVGEYSFLKRKIEGLLGKLNERTKDELHFVEMDQEDWKKEEKEGHFAQTLSLRVHQLISKIDSLISENPSRSTREIKTRFDEVIENKFEKEVLGFITQMEMKERQELEEIEIEGRLHAEQAKLWAFAELVLIATIFLFIYWAFSNWVARPIVSLEKASQQITHNDFDIQLPATLPNDEIGALTRAFEVMAGQIKSIMNQTQAYLASIVQYSNDAIIGKDTQGHIMSWNLAAEKMYGYKEDFVKGKHISIIVPANKEHEIAEILGKVSKGIPVDKFETQRHTAEGKTLDVSINISPIKNELGEVVGASAIARDITEKKKNQQRLIEAREKAEKASQAKSEFLSRMSHELRTPLNAILGFGQLIEMSARETLDQSNQNNLKHILKGGHHLLHLINEVLDLSKIEAGTLDVKLENVPYGLVVDEVITQMKPLAKSRDICIQSENMDATGYIKADLMRFKQVLINLLSNAIKYNREGGTVHISSEERPGKMIALHVADTGKGFDLSQKDLLFAPFERLNHRNESIEGTGIGLSICKSLVELQNGILEVDSKIGEGSCFSIIFPNGKN